MGFPAEIYGVAACGGAGQFRGLGLNGPAICVTDWTPWVNLLDLETMGTNDVVGDAAGTLGNPKLPAETQFEFPVSVLGDVDQSGDSFLTGSEVTTADMEASVAIGFAQNMAVLNLVALPISTGDGADILSVVDDNGVTWATRAQPLGLKKVDTPKFGFDPTGRVTKMGNYLLVVNMLAGIMVGT